MIKREQGANDTHQGEMAYFGYRKVPAHEKPALVLRHFNSIACNYDLTNTVLSFGLHLLWKRTAVKMVGLKPGDRVIDVCGGTADLSILAARAVGPTGWVVLYDINPTMMELGRSKVSKTSMAARLKYIQGDAECISIREGRFDAALVGFGARNLTRMEEGFEEMFRVLKPGGKLMCLEFSRPTAFWFQWLYDLYSFHIMPWAGKVLAGTREAYLHLSESIRTFPLPDELTAILERIGFSHVTYRRLTNGIAVIHIGVKEPS